MKCNMAAEIFRQLNIFPNGTRGPQTHNLLGELEEELGTKNIKEIQQRIIDLKASLPAELEICQLLMSNLRRKNSYGKYESIKKEAVDNVNQKINSIDQEMVALTKGGDKGNNN
jgi:hypothetical protein